MASNYVDRTIKIPASQPTVTLDPDKYLGTLGLAADKPPGNEVPHFTTFPENAKAGNWFQVVSEFTIAGMNLLKEEEWYCVTAKTDAQPAIWTRSQAGEKQLVYPIYANKIGTFMRGLSTTRQETISGTEKYLDYLTPFCTGVFDTPVIRNSPAQIINLGDLPIKNIRFDISARVDFSSENAGTRAANLILFSYYPEGNNPYSIGLSSFTIDGDFGQSGQPLKIFSQNFLIPLTDPLDEFPLTYGLTIRALQNSKINLNVIYSRISIVAWG